MKQKLDYFDVNKRIIQIMREKGFNKNSLAKELGMSQPTIKQIENNENLPSLKFLFEFKELFPDINCNWLLTGQGNKIDIVGEFNIQHGGRIEYDLDAEGYSMRYHDGQQEKPEKRGDDNARLWEMIDFQKKQIEAQTRIIEELTKKVGNDVPRRVARAGE